MLVTPGVAVAAQVNVVVPPLITVRSEGCVVMVGAVPDVLSCVTVTVCDVTPGPLTVIVAVRDAAPVLAVTVTVTVPLLFPVAGATVAHVWLLATVQPVMFEVILNV